MSKNNRTIVITGAGSGMGRATAVLFAKDAHHRLILVGRNSNALRETLSLCDHQENHIIGAFDIRDAHGWQNMFSENSNIQAIDGVFANAGVGGENHYGPNDRWDEIISTNLNGTYTTIMECYPWMKKSKERFKHVVITSSCLARFGVPNYTAYCTAKTGLLGLTKSLAVEWASQYILVNAICPGWVETEMAKAGIQLLANKEGASYDDEFRRQMSFVPLNRISQPEEIAAMVKFLMNNEQTSITGQGIDINNGSFMI